MRRTTATFQRSRRPLSTTSAGMPSAPRTDRLTATPCVTRSSVTTTTEPRSFRPFVAITWGCEARSVPNVRPAIRDSENACTAVYFPASDITRTSLHPRPALFRNEVVGSTAAGAPVARMTSKWLSTKRGVRVTMSLFRIGGLPLVSEVEHAGFAGYRRLADAEMLGRLRLASVPLPGFAHDPGLDFPEQLSQGCSPGSRCAMGQ